MTTWTLDPGRGLGPWRLGADLEAVRADLARVGEVRPGPRGPGLAVIRDDGLAVFVTTDADDHVVEIEVAPPGPPGEPGEFRCVVAATDVFAVPAGTVVEAIAARTGVVTDDGPDTVSAPAWGLSLWRGGDDHDLVDDAGNPLYFQSVLVARAP